MNRSTRVFVISWAGVVTALCLCSPATHAQQESEVMHCDIYPSAVTRPICDKPDTQKSKGPTISEFLLSDIRKAQDAQKAENWSLEAQILQAALVAHRKRISPYDKFLIDSWLGVADAQLKNYTDAAPALEAAAESQYATADQQKTMLPTVVGLYSQLQQYPQAIAVGQYAMQHGVATSDLYSTVAVDQNDLGQYKQAAATIQQLIDKEPTPEEKYLEFQLDAYNQASDQPDASKVIGELVTYYSKPDYWIDALQPLLKLHISDARLQLDVYRFMNEVGVLKMSNDWAQMAELSFDAGYPGETVAVLQKSFANNVFTDPRDITRYQHMLTSAMQKATEDEASLPSQEAKAETAVTGDLLVAVGEAYLSYGQADKAASAISQGIAKGGLKYAEEANLLLGMAQLKGHNAAEAGSTFDKVGKSDNEGYAQLGRLWVLRSKSPAAT
jgi:tetratricopeptide (TPR) repeat protein